MITTYVASYSFCDCCHIDSHVSETGYSYIANALNPHYENLTLHRHARS